jgi:monoamine oxidase
MAARELGRAGKNVTVLEARDRCGGRIHSLPTAEFGYPAEGGAEFVHGEAPVTYEAGLRRKPQVYQTNSPHHPALRMVRISQHADFEYSVFSETVCGDRRIRPPGGPPCSLIPGIATD